MTCSKLSWESSTGSLRPPTPSTKERERGLSSETEAQGWCPWPVPSRLALLLSAGPQAGHLWVCCLGSNDLSELLPPPPQCKAIPRGSGEQQSLAAAPACTPSASGEQELRAECALRGEASAKERERCSLRSPAAAAPPLTRPPARSSSGRFPGLPQHTPSSDGFCHCALSARYF